MSPSHQFIQPPQCIQPPQSTPQGTKEDGSDQTTAGRLLRRLCGRVAACGCNARGAHSATCQLARAPSCGHSRVEGQGMCLFFPRLFVSHSRQSRPHVTRVFPLYIYTPYISPAHRRCVTDSFFVFFIGFFLFADRPPFPHMAHPVSPLCQKSVLFFRFFISSRNGWAAT